MTEMAASTRRATTRLLRAKTRSWAGYSRASATVQRGLAAGHDLLPALEAFGRPDLVEFVETREGAGALRQLQPRNLATGEDVNVGLYRFRLVEGAGAQQYRIARRRVVFAPQRRAAFGTVKNVVRFAAAAGRHAERDRVGTTRLNVFALDPQIDD